jgi:RNA polymerase sigma-70 factor (ECF subfamily)
VNASLDLVRSRKRRNELAAPADTEMDDPILSLPSHDPAPDRIAMSGQVRDRVAEAMTDLSPSERTAFVLRHFEGMCIEDVSRVLGCQPGAAKHSVFRAVQKLRRALEPLASTAK